MVKKWLIYLILFLLTANIALVVSLLMKTSKSEEKLVFNKEGVEERSNRFQEHLINELGFDEVQQKKLRSLSDEFHYEQKDTKMQLWQLKKEYFGMLATENPDTVKLDSLAHKIGILETDRIKQNYKHYHRVRSICSDEQAVKYDSLGRSHMKKHLNKYGHKKYRHHSDSAQIHKD